MIKNNEYFGGNVKSLGFENEEGSATVGVMDPGEYEFSTGLKEIMTIVSGSMKVQLPNATNWKTFQKGQSFEVPKNSKFQLQIDEPVAYFCSFIKE